MLQAGQRNHRIRFERRTAVNPDSPDDFGNAESAWANLGTVWAAIRSDPKGREELVSGRLASGFSGTITVLRSGLTRGLTAADRIIVTAGPHSGGIWQIRALIPRSDAAEIEIQFESGVVS